MNLLNLINAIILIIGVPSIITACICVGRKLQILDSLKEYIDKYDLPKISFRTDCLWKKSFGESDSPLRLKTEYKKILESSNLDEQIKVKENELIQFVQNLKPFDELDAQTVIDQNINEIVKWFDLADFRKKVYDGGLSVETVPLLINLYLYEIIIPELKFPEIKE